MHSVLLSKIGTYQYQTLFYDTPKIGINTKIYDKSALNHFCLELPEYVRQGRQLLEQEGKRGEGEFISPTEQRSQKSWYLPR